MNRNSIILPVKHVTHAKLFIVAVLVSISVIIYLFSILAARNISLEYYTIISRVNHRSYFDSPSIQPEKQPYPKLLTELGMVMEVKSSQPAKQPYFKILTELGMVMEVKLLQS